MNTIGIDLGTTNSCVAYNDGQNTHVIPMSDGRRTMPSVVSYLESGEVLVGASARGQVKMNGEFTFSNVKRIIGRAWDDDADNGLQGIEGPDGMIALQGRDGIVTPVEISALILRKLRLTAEEWLGKPVTGAVVTVPAYFNEDQKTATLDAAKLAGFEDVVTLNEPMAAALASGVKPDKFSTAFVFDLGGGTFDVAVVQYASGYWEVLETNGKQRLGGVDFDSRVTDFVVEKYREENNIDLRPRRMSMLTLADASEVGKRELSDEQSTTISIPFVATDKDDRPVHLKQVITRDEFEGLVKDYVLEALTISKQCLDDAKRKKVDIQHVVMVGGMTRMPIVRDAVKAFFNGKEPMKGVNPDEVVAMGAAIKAAINDNRLAQAANTDIVSLPYGIETSGGSFLPVIPKGAKFGTSQTVVLTSERDDQLEMAIVVLQGDDSAAKGNHFLADLRHQITPAPAGEPSVSVTFQISDSGMCSVFASDEAAGMLTTILEEGRRP